MFETSVGKQKRTPALAAARADSPDSRVEKGEHIAAIVAAAGTRWRKARPAASKKSNGLVVI